MKALKVFTVKHGDIRIKVRVLKSIQQVNREFKVGNSSRLGKNLIAQSFFAPNRPEKKYVGTVVFPCKGKLAEFIPHEVTHAVLHKMGSVLNTHDETFAIAVGRLSAAILKEMGVTA